MRVLSRRDRRPVKPISLGRPPAMSDNLVWICVDHILEGEHTLQNGDFSRIAGLKPTNNDVTLFGGENMFEHRRLTDLNHLLDRRIFRTKLVAYRSWFPITRRFQTATCTNQKTEFYKQPITMGSALFIMIRNVIIVPKGWPFGPVRWNSEGVGTLQCVVKQKRVAWLEHAGTSCLHKMFKLKTDFCNLSIFHW